MEQSVQLSRTFKGQNSAVKCVAYTPSMKHLISGSQDGSIMVWNFKPQHRAYRLRGHTGAVMSIDVASGSEEIFASGSADQTVRLWKPSIRGMYKDFRAHSGGVTSVKFSDNSQFLLTGSTDKMIKLWDVSSLKPSRPPFLWCIHGHNNWVRTVDISKNCSQVCSGGDDKLVKVWDFNTSKPVATFEDHTANVRSVQFDPLSGICVASAAEDGTLNLWDIRSQFVVQHYSLPTSSAFHSIRFHPSGNYLLSTNRDSSIRVWDLREGRLLYTVTAHSKAVNACAFSKDGDYFVTAADDGIVLAWNCSALLDVEEEEVDQSTFRSIRAESPVEMEKEQTMPNGEQRPRRSRSRSKQGKHRKHGSKDRKEIPLDDDEEEEEEDRSSKHRSQNRKRSKSRKHSSSSRGMKGGDRKSSRSSRRHHKSREHRKSFEDEEEEAELEAQLEAELEEGGKSEKRRHSRSHRSREKRKSSKDHIDLKKEERRERKRSGSRTHRRPSRSHGATLGLLRKIQEMEDELAMNGATETLEKLELDDGEGESLTPTLSEEWLGDEGGLSPTVHLDRIEEVEMGDDTLEDASSNSGAPLGQHTRAAIRAAFQRRKTGNDSENSSQTNGPVNSLGDQGHIHTLARAVQNLEQRLRMSEDAIADLRHGQDELTESIHSISTS